MKKITFDKEYLEMVQQLPEHLEEYQYWLGLKERKIYFNDEVDLSIINKIVYWILQWNEEDKGKPQHERQPIEIFITTNGGCVISGLALIDAIENSKTKIITTGIGICASMGAILLLSGHERRAFKNTTILLHDGSLALQSTSKKAKQTIQYYDKLDDRIKDLVVSKTNISEELYDEKEDEEWYLFADEAKELNLIDDLI